MKDHYSLFVKYSLKQCLQTDYGDKRRIKEHNAAAEEIVRLQEELCIIENKEVLEKLLHHEDDRVRINAAVLSYKMNTFEAEAAEILREIYMSSEDPTLSFNAKMTLTTFFT